MTMICEYCGVELSAGDISVIPDKNGEYHYHVICHSCNKIQSSTVSSIGNTFHVFRCINPNSYCRTIYTKHEPEGGVDD